MLRSDDQDDYEVMKAAFTTMAEAAALATGTTVEVTYSGGATTMRNNGVLAERFRANMGAYGSSTRATIPTPAARTWPTSAGSARRSTPRSPICDEGVAGHSILFRDAAATPRADEVTLLAATLVAQTAYELFADPGARRGRLGGVPGRLTAGPPRSAVLPSPRRAPLDASSANRRRPDE